MGMWTVGYNYVKNNMSKSSQRVLLNIFFIKALEKLICSNILALGFFL